MRITFVIPDLQCGGVQKAAVTVAEELARRGHVLTVLTMGRKAEFFSVAAPVSLVCLGLKAEGPTSPAFLPFTTSRRLAALRRAIVATSADVVVTHATQVSVPTLLALIGIRTPIVVVEHGDVSPPQWR